MPSSTPFLIYMNFVVASIGFPGGDCIRKMTRGGILPSGNLYLLPQKLLKWPLRHKFILMVGISFSWTWEFTNEKQN